MNKHLTKINTMGIFIMAAVFLSACGGQPAATSAPATKVPASPAPPAVTTPAPAKVDPAVQRAKGEQIYQKTGGGTGCQACHGTDGKGKPNTAPDVRGASADDIKRALGGDAMSFIRLPDDDIEAVAAYLKYLQSQP
ncbi:MAG: c-type cytochrome [Chloroflexi bacterium]|nr:c-type cytochrome [Chloroflexota bacterium]